MLLSIVTCYVDHYACSNEKIFLQDFQEMLIIYGGVCVSYDQITMEPQSPLFKD